MWGMPIKMHYNAAAYRPGLLDEPWYDDLIQEYLDAIARRGYIVEVNTKSYLELGTFYPNERYFPVLLEKGIRVQVNSDSHYPERINNGRLQALAVLQASGYHTVTEMYNNEWKDMPSSFIHDSCDFTISFSIKNLQWLFDR